MVSWSEHKAVFAELGHKLSSLSTPGPCVNISETRKLILTFKKHLMTKIYLPQIENVTERLRTLKKVLWLQSSPLTSEYRILRMTMDCVNGLFQQIEAAHWSVLVDLWDICF